MDNNTEVFENNTTETNASENTTVESTTDNSSAYGYYQDNTANIPYRAPIDEEPVTTNGLQITGLVMGILSIVSCWCYGIFGIIFAIVGMICAIIGNKKGRTGVGIAGLVCSIIGLILSIIALIYFVVVLGVAFSMFSNMSPSDLESMMNMDPSEVESMLEIYGY